MSDNTLKDDRTRGEVSQAGYANSEVRRNPDQPTANVDEDSRGEGSEERTISPSVGDTSEDLIDRLEDDAPARDQSGAPIDPR